MPAKGFLMMTALPPTYGHRSLIEWAKRYCVSAGIRTLHVLICEQPQEPMTGGMRTHILQNDTSIGWAWDGVQVIFHTFMNTLPTEPEHDTLFWAKWQAAIFREVGEFYADDIVFSSEAYGYPLARVLGCTHVIFDPSRHVVKAKATRVRNEPIRYFRDMLPTAQFQFRKTVTIFGAESTGKTTLAKSLANLYDGQFGHFTPEWARPYLESQPSGPDVTDERMGVIVHGQRATEQAARGLQDKPFIVRDTDLLSTVGYYGLYSPHNHPVVAVDKADLYIVCPSNIPFEPDPLRYGGDKRESDDQYWIDLLERYDCNYVVLEDKGIGMRNVEAHYHMTKLFLDNPLWGYKRE